MRSERLQKYLKLIGDNQYAGVFMLDLQLPSRQLCPLAFSILLRHHCALFNAGRPVIPENLCELCVDKYGNAQFLVKCSIQFLWNLGPVRKFGEEATVHIVAVADVLSGAK